MDLLSILFGIPFGIIASLIAWWVLTHCIVPKIKHAPFISKVKIIGENNYKYRIGIRNVGKRDMIDVEIIFELLIKGLDKTIPSNTAFIQLNLNKPRIPMMKKNRQWVFLIDTSKLPDSLNSKYKGYSIEELLNIKNAKAKITTFGYDKFSGTRKVFESQTYTKNNIVEKKFEKTDYDK